MYDEHSEVADESAQVPQPIRSTIMTPNAKHSLPTPPDSSSKMYLGRRQAQSPTPGATHNLAEHMMASLKLDDVQEKGVEVEVEVQEANPIVKESRM